MKMMLNDIPNNSKINIAVRKKDGTNVEFAASVINNRLGDKYPEHSVQLNTVKELSTLYNANEIKSISVIYPVNKESVHRFYQCQFFAIKHFFAKEVVGLYASRSSINENARQYKRYKIIGSVELKNGDDEMYSGSFFDMSAGGFSFKLNGTKTPECGRILSGLGQIGSNTFWLKGRVVRVNNNDDGSFLVGCEFLEKSIAVQNIISVLEKEI